MKIIGLTGSIGMGKSSTAALLKTLGIPVFDSDACVHNLLVGKAVSAVTDAFPSVWNAHKQSIDRQKLGRLVFSDPAAKTKLESLLHPLVFAEQNKFIAQHRKLGTQQIVLDIPLLFETGRDRICDLVICVTAPRFIQEQRVLARPHMTPSKFKAIVNSQWPDRDKQMRADLVIPTGLGRATTLKYLKKALEL